jgi:hypothetical protein
MATTRVAIGNRRQQYRNTILGRRWAVLLKAAIGHQASERLRVHTEIFAKNSKAPSVAFCDPWTREQESPISFGNGADLLAVNSTIEVQLSSLEAVSNCRWQTRALVLQPF